jgi:hypothetical protein
LIVEYVNSSHPPRTQKQYGHLDWSFWKGANDQFYFNSRAEIFENLGRQRQIVSLYIPQTKDDRIYENCYYRTVFDVCKTARHVLANSVIRAFIDGFMNGADHIFGKR